MKNKKYDVVFKANVQRAPGFKNGAYEIPIKVTLVETSDDSLRKKLKEVRTLYYDGHTLTIFSGDGIRAYGSIDQIVREGRPQRIERLSTQGSVMAFYDRQDSKPGNE